MSYVENRLREVKEFLGRVYYNTRFNFDHPGTRITISFERPNHTPAPDSSVNLPESLEVLGPEPGTNFTRQDDITVSWRPPGPTGIGFEGTCHNGKSVSFRKNYVGNPGPETYSATYLLSGIANLDPYAVCTTKITLVRSTTGMLSGQYKGGAITARREASVSVNIAP